VIAFRVREIRVEAAHPFEALHVCVNDLVAEEVKVKVVLLIYQGQLVKSKN
jgi:hypothetical protein